MDALLLSDGLTLISPRRTSSVFDEWQCMAASSIEVVWHVRLTEQEPEFELSYS